MKKKEKMIEHHGKMYLNTNYNLHKLGLSKDAQLRKRITFLMKTPMDEVVNSWYYHRLCYHCIKDNGNGWWYFHRVVIHNRKIPWMWQFNVNRGKKYGSK